MNQAQRIAVGDTAPGFELYDNRKRLVRLADYQGRMVLLSWHPLAWTPVCADQMKALEAHIQEFEKANAVAFGLSIDSVPSKNHWAKELSVAQTMLLSDFWPHGAVAQSFGLFREADGYSERANVLLDARGVVTWVKVYPVHDLPDIDEVLKQLSSR